MYWVDSKLTCVCGNDEITKTTLVCIGSYFDPSQSVHPFKGMHLYLSNVIHPFKNMGMVPLLEAN